MQQSLESIVRPINPIQKMSIFLDFSCLSFELSLNLEINLYMLLSLIMTTQSISDNSVEFTEFFLNRMKDFNDFCGRYPSNSNAQKHFRESKRKKKQLIFATKMQML